jgi:hypothetical protein
MSENLAKARAAARADQPAPTWRLIITDSESPTGLAPVCTGERSDALHMIDDYPGGPQRDEDGVYDCCPWPQIETYSTVWAAYLVELLNADAGEEASAQAPTATPTDTNRRARLLHEITFDGGRWKSGDVARWYQTQGLTGLDVRAARHDLATLRDSGAITQHDTAGVRFYTRASRTTRKDGSK